jgi:dTDP-4-amino-4,6-dideoxygalactose transaminase
MSKLAINGGPKACDHEWPRWPQWDDAERKELNGVLESGDWWYGAKVEEFEKQFAEFHGAKYGITCTNGTAALEASLLALGIGAGDEVIVPPLTFLATASAVLRINAVPVFADVEADTGCLDPIEAEKKITDKTKAIIPVHFAGYVADMDRFNALASKYKIHIVEDACHSWGSQWKGKGTGALGTCGAFSFQASKNICSGEGGIILTDSEEVADNCRSYINCGRGKDTPWYEHFVLGGNLRMTEFQAAILLGQMTRLEKQTLQRMRSADILAAELKRIPGIILLKDDPRMTRRAYHFFSFRVDLETMGIGHKKFIEALQAEGVQASLPYPHPLYKNPLFLRKGNGAQYCPVSCPYYGREMDYGKVCCPITEQLLSDTVWISHTSLLAEENAIRDMAIAIRKVCENIREI